METSERQNNSEKHSFPVFTWSNPISATKQTKSDGIKLENQHPLSISDKFPSPPVPDSTHWIVPGRILAGGSPNEMTRREILSIIESGIDTFVNLQNEFNEYAYEYTLQNMVALNKTKFPPHPINFLHCPIPDQGVLSDHDMCEFIQELIKILEVHHCNIYIHCYGGHGRTGSVLVHLLQALFSISKDSAMEVIRRSHEKRNCWPFCALNLGQLESSSQENQVKRLELIMRNRQRNIREPQTSLDDTDGMLFAQNFASIFM